MKLLPCHARWPSGLLLRPFYALWRFDENVPVCPPLGRYWEPQADAIEAKNERTTERSGMLVVHGEQNWDVVLAGE
jgi:hypothetical protein